MGLCFISPTSASSASLRTPCSVIVGCSSLSCCCQHGFLFGDVVWSCGFCILVEISTRLLSVYPKGIPGLPGNQDIPDCDLLVFSHDLL